MTGFIPKDSEFKKDLKIVMLGDYNLALIKGYKAEVAKQLSVYPDKLKRRRAYVIITITGLSNKAATQLENSFEILRKEEVTEASE